MTHRAARDDLGRSRAARDRGGRSSGYTREAPGDHDVVRCDVSRDDRVELVERHDDRTPADDVDLDPAAPNPGDAEPLGRQTMTLTRARRRGVDLEVPSAAVAVAMLALDTLGIQSIIRSIRRRSVGRSTTTGSSTATTRARGTPNDSVDTGSGDGTRSPIGSTR